TLPAGTGDRRALHSLPTRRSSDLQFRLAGDDPGGGTAQKFMSRIKHQIGALYEETLEIVFGRRVHDHRYALVMGDFAEDFELERSEEHTSELESRENLVCRLLLET